MPCYLVVHERGTLLWETGLGDRFASEPNPRDAGWIARTTLRAQLADLGYGPDDIDYLAISHMHADHTGNANDYAGTRATIEDVLASTRGQLWIGHDIREYERLVERGRSGIW